MKPAIHDASARQHAGGPSLVAGRGGNRNERARKPDLSEVEAEIAGLARSIDAGSAACLAPVASHWTAAWASVAIC